jgi:hypothetical protein
MTAAAEPTIDELKAIQAQFDLRAEHLCWLGPERFVIAHTDEERETIPLDQCELHQWLHGHSGAPDAPGYYRVHPHVADLDSESYGALPWDFSPLDVEWNPTEDVWVRARVVHVHENGDLNIQLDDNEQVLTVEQRHVRRSA